MVRAHQVFAFEDMEDVQLVVEGQREVRAIPLSLKGATASPSGRKGRKEGKLSDLNQRIEAMHRSDVRIAWAFVLGLWLSIIFIAMASSAS